MLRRELLAGVAAAATILVMPARAANRSTASTKSQPSTARTNEMASPLAWQPKQ